MSKVYRITVNQQKSVKAPDYVWVDEEMLNDRGFCEGCECIEEEPYINWTSCPAGWDMRDKACPRNHLCEEVFEIVDALNQKLDEVCGFNLNNGIIIDSSTKEFF